MYKNENLDGGGPSPPSPLPLSLPPLSVNDCSGRNLLKVVKDERSCTSPVRSSLCPQERARPAGYPIKIPRGSPELGPPSSSPLHRVTARARARARRACVHRAPSGHLGAPFESDYARIGPSRSGPKVGHNSSVLMLTPYYDVAAKRNFEVGNCDRRIEISTRKI